ncbi:TerC family protein, partial [Streptomyces sp. NPDC090303]
SGVHVPEITIPFSLTFIGGVLVITTITSLIAAKKRSEREAAGGLADADAAETDGSRGFRS